MKFSSTLGTVFLMLFTSLAVCQSSSSLINLVKQASSQQQDGKLEEAISTYEKILKINPQDPMALQGIKKCRQQLEKQKKERQDKQNRVQNEQKKHELLDYNVEMTKQLVAKGDVALAIKYAKQVMDVSDLDERIIHLTEKVAELDKIDECNLWIDFLLEYPGAQKKLAKLIKNIPYDSKLRKLLDNELRSNRPKAFKQLVMYSEFLHWRHLVEEKYAKKNAEGVIDYMELIASWNFADAYPSELLTKKEWQFLQNVTKNYFVVCTKGRIGGKKFGELAGGADSSFVQIRYLRNAIFFARKIRGKFVNVWITPDMVQNVSYTNKKESFFVANNRYTFTFKSSNPLHLEYVRVLVAHSFGNTPGEKAFPFCRDLFSKFPSNDIDRFIKFLRKAGFNPQLDQ